MINFSMKSEIFLWIIRLKTSEQLLSKEIGLQFSTDVLYWYNLVDTAIPWNVMRFKTI